MNLRDTALGLLACMLLAACTVSPYQREVNATCGQYMPANQTCFNSCGGVVLIELPFVGMCEGIYFLQRELTPAPARSVHDGIYAAPSGSFSVRPPEDQPPLVYRAEQASLHGLSYVSFMPSAPSAPAYMVAVMADHGASKADEPREDSIPSQLGVGVLGLSYATFGKVERLRDPLEVTLDGRPARLGVYANFDYNSRVAAYFLVYSERAPDAQATLSISWSGRCLHCKDGSEAEILADAPGAEQFLKSFHLTDDGATP